MQAPPATINEATVLEVADLTGAGASGATRHIVGGEEASDFAGLALARYAGDAGVYLYYCDAAWNAITDTFHDDVASAKDQAEFEFGTLSWVDGR